MRALLLMMFTAGCSPSVETMPFEGPDGVTSVQTDAEEVLVATTFLRVRNAPGPGNRFGNHASGIAESLYETPPAGWLGAAFRNKGQLQWWTMTVWESEEAMIEFVLSDIHVAAMADLENISTEARSRSAWMPVAEATDDWPRLLRQLDAEPGYEFER